MDFAHELTYDDPVLARNSNIRAVVAKLMLGAVLSVMLGIVGGAVCGALILSFGDVIGRSGTTGCEYVGCWNTATVWLGFLYGGYFGGVVAPVAYITMVRRIGFRRALFPATGGTLAGGFLGAIAGPPLAVLTGIIGFFIGIGWAVHSNSRGTDRTS